MSGFRDYLRCGRLEYGFILIKCNVCRHEHLVACSCKRRGFCHECHLAAVSCTCYVIKVLVADEFLLKPPDERRFELGILGEHR